MSFVGKSTLCNPTDEIDDNIFGDSDIKRDVISNWKPKINIAIDFGTDGTGVAYSIPGKDHVYKFGKLRVFDKTQGNTQCNKVRTAILLDRKGKLKAFGTNAITTYLLYIIYIGTI